MKAAIFENPGLENLRVMDNIKEPQVTGHDVIYKSQNCWYIHKADSLEEEESNSAEGKTTNGVF